MSESDEESPEIMKIMTDSLAENNLMGKDSK